MPWPTSPPLGPAAGSQASPTGRGAPGHTYPPTHDVTANKNKARKAVERKLARDSSAVLDVFRLHGEMRAARHDGAACSPAGWPAALWSEANYWHHPYSSSAAQAPVSASYLQEFRVPPPLKTQGPPPPPTRRLLEVQHAPSPAESPTPQVSRAHRYPAQVVHPPPSRVHPRMGRRCLPRTSATVRSGGCQWSARPWNRTAALFSRVVTRGGTPRARGLLLHQPLSQPNPAPPPPSPWGSAKKELPGAHKVFPQIKHPPPPLTEGSQNGSPAVHSSNNTQTVALQAHSVTPLPPPAPQHAAYAPRLKSGGGGSMSTEATHIPQLNGANPPPPPPRALPPPCPSRFPSARRKTRSHRPNHPDARHEGAPRRRPPPNLLVPRPHAPSP